MPRRFFSLSFDYVHVINYLTTRNNAAPPIKSNPPVTTHNGSESVNYSRAPYDTNVFYVVGRFKQSGTGNFRPHAKYSRIHYF